MIIAIIIALVIGAGTSATAESSLPGDLLYPVKVSINENVRAALTLSEEAEAHWRVRIVERRAEEAEHLVADGKINSEISADIQASIEEDFKAVENMISKLLTDGRHNVAFQVSSSLESTLTAHSDILTKIMVKRPDAKNDIQPIINKIKIKIDLATQSRTKAEAAENKEALIHSETSAEGKLTATENKLEEVEKFYANRKDHLSTQIRADIDAQLKLATDNIARGKVFLESKNYTLAFENFNKAARILQEAKILMIAGKELKITIPTNSNVRVDIDTNGKAMSDPQNEDKNTIKGESETDLEVNDDLKADSKTRIQIQL